MEKAGDAGSCCRPSQLFFIIYSFNFFFWSHFVEKHKRSLSGKRRRCWQMLPAISIFLLLIFSLFIDFFFIICSPFCWKTKKISQWKKKGMLAAVAGHHRHLHQNLSWQLNTTTHIYKYSNTRNKYSNTNTQKQPNKYSNTQTQHKYKNTNAVIEIHKYTNKQKTNRVIQQHQCHTHNILLFRTYLRMIKSEG